MMIHSTPKLRGRVVLPASKSICNRALVISAMSREGHRMGAEGAGNLKNLSDCDDTRAMWHALTALPDTIDIGAAGTAMRFLAAYLSVTKGTRVITGTERMKNRPIGILAEALCLLGARVEYVEKEGFPPLRITGGRHKGGRVTLPGNVSSQYISALLMIGPVLQEGLELVLTGGIASRPYIDMTLHIMRRFDAKAEWTGADSLRVEPTGYAAVPYFVENDWSAASYWYEMVALSPDAGACVELPGLFSESLQGDAAVKELFARLGVSTTFYTTEEGVEGVRLQKEGTIAKRLDYDFAHKPDLAQTLVATCCALDIPFRFSGLQSLKIKETDRIHALRTELGKLGFPLGEEEEEDGTLFWNGERTVPQPDAALDTYEDHRMAMSLAPLCLRLGPLQMNNPQVVSKSYPTFWRDLEQMGFTLEKEGGLC